MIAEESAAAGAQTADVPDLSRGVAMAKAVVEALVDDPSAVVVSTAAGSSAPRIEVQVAQADLGRVIGRRGRTAAIIRTLVRAGAHIDGSRVEIEFQSDSEDD